MDWDIKLFRKFDRTTVHHPCAQTCQLQHLVIAHLFGFAGLRQNSRIGRKHAIDIRVDFTCIRLQYRGQCNGGGVTTTTSQRCDVKVVVNSLKTRRNHDISFA